MSPLLYRLSYGPLPATISENETYCTSRVATFSLLRFLWGEAAGHAVRHDPELHRFYRRKLVQKGVRKARVPVAGKLGIRMFVTPVRNSLARPPRLTMVAAPACRTLYVMLIRSPSPTITWDCLERQVTGISLILAGRSTTK